MPKLAYTPPGPVAKAFLKSDAFVRGLRGPIGAGKSVTCCVEILRRATQQAPDRSGVKRTRWAVIRNTFPELKSTTLKTWLDWFPEDQWGKLNRSPPMTHHIKMGDLDCEVIFLALDNEADVKKLLSLELTGAWVNEARELPKAVIDGVTSRVDRYPSKKDGGPGATWAGVIMDTNAPDEFHWWPIMAGEIPPPDWMAPEERLTMVRPANWEFFTQPPAMLEQLKHGELVGYEINPKAENLANLSPSYYPNAITGKGRTWIRVYILNQLARLADGKPVYPTFRREVHVAREQLVPVKGLPIRVGIDFGRSPAAVLAQELHGRWLILHEIVGQDMGADRFAKLVKRQLAEMGLSDWEIRFYGDPTGDHRPQTDDTTPFDIFRTNGITVLPSPSNDPVVRVEAVEGALNRLVDGKPGLLVSPQCIVLTAGFEGGYQYRKLLVTGAERYEDSPNKNQFSHPHDALQYALLGGGEGRRVLRGSTAPARPTVARMAWNPFERRASVAKKVMRPKGWRR